MNNSAATPPDILALIKNHGPEILEALRKRKEERGVTKADIINLTGVPQSSFYRFWDGDGKNLNPDHISKICLFLGVSIDDFRRDPDDTSIAKLGIPATAHEDVMTNIHAELNKQRETISALSDTIEELDERNKILESKLSEKNDELVQSHTMYAEKINKLTDALLELHNQMHGLNVSHNARVDHINDELSKRYDQMHNLFHFFQKVFANHPETLRRIAQEIEE